MTSAKGGRALVLSGGGVAGIAWQIGVLSALEQAGVRLAEADLIVGTSAGATVGAQIATGVPLDRLVAMQRTEQVSEIYVPYDNSERRVFLTRLVEGAANEQEARRRLGQLGLEAQTIPEAERRAVIASRLPVHEWPERPLKLTAVEAQTGDWVAFDKDSGVSLVDAVAASCAVPGVWPPSTIHGKRYVDGGARSSSNADLAKGYERVVVLVTRLLQNREKRNFDAEMETLGQRAFIVQSDDAARAAFGLNPLDPAVRVPALEAGLRQGRGLARGIAAYWNA
ncbi:MAG TPA: patatin-like phospholipase family protein [Burkholderiales bacterium]|nr:patatin-like phospholipase family protein [Burkholderiales bacterium]